MSRAHIFSDRGGWWRGIAPGDTVTYSTPQGGVFSGKVVISTSTHVVLNAGGRYGTPKVVDEGNYIGHKAVVDKKTRKKKKP